MPKLRAHDCRDTATVTTVRNSSKSLISSNGHWTRTTCIWIYAVSLKLPLFLGLSWCNWNHHKICSKWCRLNKDKACECAVCFYKTIYLVHCSNELFFFSWKYFYCYPSAFSPPFGVMKVMLRKTFCQRDYRHPLNVVALGSFRFTTFVLTIIHCGKDPSRTWNYKWEQSTHLT